MRFVSFVKSLPQQEDKYLKAFIEYVKVTNEFPLSSDPAILGLYLHNKLNEEQTRGYMLLMFIYREEPKNLIPKSYITKDDFLSAVNTIVEWQNHYTKEEPDISRPENLKISYHATRPFEHICFYPVEFPTKDGGCYIFIWVDAFSHFLFQTGIENKVDDHLILKHLHLFLNDPNFVLYFRHLPLSLFLHKYDHLVPSINEVLKPANGKTVVHDQYVAKIVVPVMEQLFSFLMEKKG